MNNQGRKKPYIFLCAAVILITICCLCTQSALPDELNNSMLFDLWKYQTDRGETGLLTGKPSKPQPAKTLAATATIRGTVSSRPHNALHARDIVEIQLLDVSSLDAPAVVIAQEKISSPDQFPIPFKLSYDPARINPTHQYAIQARIMRNGEPVFNNTFPCFVITHGYPNYAEVVVEMTDTQPAAPAETDVLLPPSIGNPRMYIGTYVRSYTGADGKVAETLQVLSDNTIALQSRYPEGTVKQTGVWSLEKKLLAVTLTQKNGEYTGVERIVFELRGDHLIAVEYDRAAYGTQYSFTRTAGKEPIR